VRIQPQLREHGGSRLDIIDNAGSEYMAVRVDKHHNAQFTDIPKRIRESRFPVSQAKAEFIETPNLSNHGPGSD
jgi:hypothetical protein